MDKVILEMSIKKLSEAFDRFVDECTDDEGKPKQPDMKALMVARGYLPPYCKRAYKKK